MKLAENIYTNDEHVCPVCGEDMELVTYYRGRKVDHQVYSNESLLTGTKTTTAVMTYTDVCPQSARYCIACKQRAEDAIRARNRPDEKVVLKLLKKKKIKNISILFLSIIIPVAFGFATSASYRSNTVDKSLDTLTSILLLLTIGTVLLGIRTFWVSLSNLIHWEAPWEQTIPYVGMEQRIVSLLNGRKEDRSIQYLTEAEYQKLQPKR